MNPRLAVIGVYGAYIALVTFILVLGGKQMMLPAFPPAIFAIAAWIGLWVIASQKPYWRLANAPATELDERELRDRMGAYWLAYIALFTVMFIALVALSLGSDIMRIKTWDVSDVSALLWGVFLLGMTLPAAVLMWTHNILLVEDDA